MDREPVYLMLSQCGDNKSKLFSVLRSLPIDVVGDVMLGIQDEYENLRQLLPSMASEQDQTDWTGSSGYTLLMQSSAFVRTLENNYIKTTKKQLANKKILDFGCGWGRLIRLMYKFTEPENIYGCDPWDKSIDNCRKHNIQAHLELSDYLPENLPFPNVKFDLIYAFSVYTHLSEKAMYKTLQACRKKIANDGLLAITIRPKSYWDYHVDTVDKIDREQMKTAHDTVGFAHTGHRQRADSNGEILYGDKSMTIEYIKTNWKEWNVVGTDIFLQDPFQTVVFLTPATQE